MQNLICTLVLRCKKFSYSCITGTVDVVTVCRFTHVLCIILTLSHSDEFVRLGLLLRREADRIVHVGLLEIRKGTTSSGIM